MNCWEFMECGRQVGGMNTPTLGVCPASTQKSLDGVHGGKNAGRACWVIAGTFCGGKIQGTFAEKERNCLSCEFYRSVKNEERGGSRGFVMSRELLSMIGS